MNRLTFKQRLGIIVAIIVLVIVLVGCKTTEQTFVAEKSFLVSYYDGGDPCVIFQGVEYTKNSRGFYAAVDGLEPCAGYVYP